jgi:sugar phosphate isomerase/epimerase
MRSAEVGCRVCLENVFDLDPGALAGLLGRLPAGEFGATFDVGHWHAWSRASLADWLEAIGPRIHALHVHDNRGHADEHLALGAGSVPYGEVLPSLRALGRPLDWTLEATDVADVLGGLRYLANRSGIPEFEALADTPPPGDAPPEAP